MIFPPTAASCTMLRYPLAFTLPLPKMSPFTVSTLAMYTEFVVSSYVNPTAPFMNWSF